MLEARDLVAYRGERPVAHATRIDLAEGEHLALLGPNGAGKSSLVLGLAALVRTGGELRYRGELVRGADGDGHARPRRGPVARRSHRRRDLRRAAPTRHGRDGVRHADGP